MIQAHKGQIVYNDVTPSVLERKTAEVFALAGEMVEFIPASNIPGVKTADIKINGVEWEMKHPRVCRERTLEKLLQHAVKQSANVIFDVRLLKKKQKVAQNTLLRLFRNSKTARRIRVLTDNYLLTADKKSGKIDTLTIGMNG